MLVRKTHGCWLQKYMFVSKGKELNHTINLGGRYKKKEASVPCSYQEIATFNNLSKRRYYIKNFAYQFGGYAARIAKNQLQLKQHREQKREVAQLPVM